MATTNAPTTAAGIGDAHAGMGSGPDTGQATGTFNAAAMASDTNRAAPTTAADFAPVAARANEHKQAPTTPPNDQDDDWPDAPMTDPQTVILPTEDEAPGDAHEAVDTVPPEQADARAADMLARERTAETAFVQPSFLHNDSRQAALWRRPAMRIALLVIVLVLLALLGAQFLVKERSRVAAVEPAMRPLLHAVCAVAGCTVDPLRQIESIVIDSSSFSRVRDNDYHLGFSLKNTAPIDVAMPAIELSLTDPQDQPVIRRVILPAEFGAPGAALARSSVWNGSLALGVQPGVGAQRIAGYRLLAFYP
ncbi:MAG: DUF3426 domain-containing protein [Burkholderiaceae bacterium]